MHRPAAAFCFYFVQYVHDRHFPLLGSLGDADRVLADIKKLKTAGGAGVTNVLRDRVRPIAELYIQDQMTDVYEVQAARRAVFTTAAAAAAANSPVTYSTHISHHLHTHAHTHTHTHSHTRMHTHAYTHKHADSL